MEMSQQGLIEGRGRGVVTRQREGGRRKARQVAVHNCDCRGRGRGWGHG